MRREEDELDVWTGCDHYSLITSSPDKSRSCVSIIFIIQTIQSKLSIHPLIVSISRTYAMLFRHY